MEVGAGGSIVLKLAQTASTDGFTIGVHTGFGLADADYPNGVNTDPASYVNSFLRQANVMVSADGVNWGNLGAVTFDNPSNIDTGAATDPEGNSPGVGPAADPGKPFLGSLSSFNGQDWQGTLAVLNGSAGGTWLNLSGITDENGNPIAGVNFIKFSVPGSAPLDPNTGNPEIMMIDAVVGTNSASTITPSGGTGAVTLAISNIQHAIPGLTIPASGTGSLAVTGTPTATGTMTFTVTATDSVGATTTTDYSITVNTAVSLSPAPLPADTINVAYNETITAGGGTGTVTLVVSNIQNAIPGLTIPTSATNGLTISGAPTAAGTETFTVTATDAANGATATTDYSITVNPAVSITPPSLPADTVNVPYNQAFTAGGAINAFYANQVVGYVPGAIPDASYYNPAAALGGLNPMVGSYAGVNYYLTPFDPAFSSSDLVEVGAGGSLVLKLAETASTNGDTIGVHTGFGLADADYPNGVNTDPASSFDAWLRQADVLVSADGVNWGNLGTITFDSPSNIDAGLATDPDGLAPGVGPLANPGQPFLGSLNSFNGQNWQGTLAALNGSAGGTWLNLTGVTDENGNPIAGVNYIEFSVPGSPPLDPNTGNPEIMMIDAVVGTNSAATINANGGTGAITLAVSNVQHAIPGLTVPGTGVGSLAISGTPTGAGTETFTVTATDALGSTTTTDYSITVNPAVAVSPTTLPADTINIAYTQTIGASSGTGAITLAVSNLVNAIPGLTIPTTAAGSLALSGTPTATGTETFTVTATDAVGATTTTDYAITVNPAVSLSTATLPADALDAVYNETIATSGGTGAITLTVTHLLNPINGLSDPDQRHRQPGHRR